MELSDDTRTRLFDAGAAAVAFNAPLGMERATQLVWRLAADAPARVVDLGCGRGALTMLVAERLPAATVVGIDLDERSVLAARRSSEELPADARPRFEVADVRSARHEADAVICVGASHAFGAPADLFTTLAAVSPTGTALVGDGVWQATPDPWCVETFGRLPSGPDDLAARAAEAGWSIDDVDTSTLAEWDQFEQGWIEGARSTGLPEANRFADERWRQYQRYRGVLGFCWLVLTR